MAGITLEIAQQKLGQALAAQEKIFLAQETDMDGSRLTLANLEAVQQSIKFWNGMVNELTPTTSGGGIRVREIIPR